MKKMFVYMQWLLLVQLDINIITISGDSYNYKNKILPCFCAEIMDSLWEQTLGTTPLIYHPALIPSIKKTSSFKKLVKIAANATAASAINSLLV